MNWADELILEYKDEKRALHGMHAALSDFPQDKHDKTQINSMLESMDYAIEWMETGRQPDSYKGAEMRGIYQFEDMDILPDITENLKEERGQLYMDREQRKLMLRLFRFLSDRERQSYIMFKAEGISMGEIAKRFGVSKGTVQSYIKRAKRKIEEVVS